MKFQMKQVTSTALPIIAGGIGAKLVKSMTKNMVKNDKLRAALPVIAGLFLVSNKKMQMVGYGMIAVGGADLMGTVVPSLAGIEDMDLSGVFDELTGPNDLYNVGGPLNDELSEDINGPLNDDLSGIEGSDYDQY